MCPYPKLGGLSLGPPWIAGVRQSRKMLDRSAPAFSATPPRVRGAAFDWAAGKLIEWPPPPRARGGPDFSAFNNLHHREANRGHRHSDGEWHTRRLRLRGRRDSTHGRHCNAPQPAPGGASVSAKPHRPKEDSRDMDTWDQAPNSPLPSPWPAAWAAPSRWWRNCRAVR